MHQLFSLSSDDQVVKNSFKNVTFLPDFLILTGSGENAGADLGVVFSILSNTEVPRAPRSAGDIIW